jgi:hypothetical protein
MIYFTVTNICEIRMVEGRVVYRVLVGKPEGKRSLGRTGLDGRIILKWVLKK